MIKDNVRKILEGIPTNVKVLAATKTQTTEEIKEAVDSGIEIIGENYVQEAEKKYPEINAKKHFIGHLQKNKVKKALEIFDLIETVDSYELAKEIDKKILNFPDKIPFPIFIEVNIGKEPNKASIFPENTEKLIEDISKLKNIKIAGLMTMAPFFDDAEKYRPYFREMKELFDKIKIKHPKIATISMGMSDSYKIAIEEGSNLVRIGTKIFGPRK